MCSAVSASSSGKQERSRLCHGSNGWKRRCRQISSRSGSEKSSRPRIRAADPARPRDNAAPSPSWKAPPAKNHAGARLRPHHAASHEPTHGLTRRRAPSLLASGATIRLTAAAPPLKTPACLPPGCRSRIDAGCSRRRLLPASGAAHAESAGSLTMAHSTCPDPRP